MIWSPLTYYDEIQVRSLINLKMMFLPLIVYLCSLLQQTPDVKLACDAHSQSTAPSLPRKYDFLQFSTPVFHINFKQVMYYVYGSVLLLCIMYVANLC